MYDFYLDFAGIYSTLGTWCWFSLVFTALWARGVDFHWYLQHFGTETFVFLAICSTLEGCLSYFALFTALFINTHQNPWYMHGNLKDRNVTFSKLYFLNGGDKMDTHTHNFRFCINPWLKHDHFEYFFASEAQVPRETLLQVNFQQQQPPHSLLFAALWNTCLSDSLLLATCWNKQPSYSLLLARNWKAWPSCSVVFAALWNGNLRIPCYLQHFGRVSFIFRAIYSTFYQHASKSMIYAWKSQR